MATERIAEGILTTTLRARATLTSVILPSVPLTRKNMMRIMALVPAAVITMRICAGKR